MVRHLTLLLSFCVGCSNCEAEPTQLEVPRPDPEPSVDAAWEAIEIPAAAGSLGASLSASEAQILATWIEPDGEEHRVRFATYDGEWTEPITVARGADLIANWADFPRSARGGDGAIYVHHLHRSGEAAYAYEIRLSRKVGDGAFESLGVVHRDGTPTEHGFVSMVPTEDGVRLFWLDGRATVQEGGATQLFTALVTDEVGEATFIDSRVCDCCQTDGVMTNSGPLVGFRDRGEDEVRDISVARWGEDGFGSPVSVHADGWEIAGCPVNGPQLGANDTGVAVAWFTGATGGSVRVAFGDGNSFGAPIDIDDRQPPGRVDLAILDDGAAVSWLARAAGGGEVRVRYASRTGELGATTVVGSTGVARASGFPVMVEWDRHLYVVYRRGEHLELARRPSASLPRAPSRHEEDAPVAVVSAGQPLPAAPVMRSDDTVLDLGDRKPVVAAFFARWCQPCREELRMLDEIRGEHSDWTVVAVSLDEGSGQRAERVARGWGFEGEVLRDAGAAEALGVPPLPGLFVVDRAGVVRLASSIVTADELRAALD